MQGLVYFHSLVSAVTIFMLNNHLKHEHYVCISYTLGSLTSDLSYVVFAMDACLCVFVCSLWSIMYINIFPLPLQSDVFGDCVKRDQPIVCE